MELSEDEREIMKNLSVTIWGYVKLKKEKKKKEGERR